MSMIVGEDILRFVLACGARRTARCVFVLSTGRVGTMTLTRLLNLSPDVEARHEPRPQLLEETKRAYELPLSEGDRSRIFRQFSASRVRALLRASRRPRIYVECSNRLTFLATLLADRLPSSRFIYLHRNPAAVVRSGMLRKWYDGHPWDPYRIRPRADDPWADDWSNWGPFEKCCWLWDAVNAFSLDVTAKLPRYRVLRLSTEALYCPDGNEASRLFDWLGVSPRNPAAIRRVVGTRYNAQEVGEQFPAWPAWTAEAKATLAKIAGATSRRLGYGQCAEGA